METQKDKQADDNLKNKRRLSWRWFKELTILVMVLIFIGVVIDYYRLQARDSQLISSAELSALVSQLTIPQQKRFSSGEPLLVYVWATWCGVCNLTSAAVSSIAESGHLVASIALKSGSEKKIKQYLMKQDYVFSSFSDRQGALTQALGVKGTPTFFILNRQGEIKYYSMGVNTEIGLRAKLALFSEK